MAMHNALHLKSNVGKAKNDGRGLQDVEKTTNLPNVGLENYVKESRESLITVAKSVDIELTEPIRETTIEAKKQKKEENVFLRGKIVAWPVY